MAASETARRGPGRRLEEGLHQERDVALALAQRRQLEVEHGEAVEEILAQRGARASWGAPGARWRRRCAPVARSCSWLPTRSKVPSWSTRRSLVWSAGSRSPISSRKSVPPAAASKRPSRRAAAPVKAPFSWPKSSLSTSVGGSAAKFTATNGARLARAVLVDGARHQLLAGAALAGDQHRHRRRGGAADRLPHGEHARARADQRGRRRRRRSAGGRGGDRGGRLHRAAERLEQVSRSKGLVT